ncbi:MAG: bacteriohemerythrin [Magnetovibrionaceae bacterium]
MFDFSWNHEAAVWNAGYDTGVSDMDNEHKYLLSQINVVDGAIQDGSGMGKVLGLLGELRQATVQHFSHEESLMAAADYPGLDGHKSLHGVLLDMLDDLIDQTRAGNRENLKTTAGEYLKTWLIGHIMVADQDYAPVVLKFQSEPAE